MTGHSFSDARVLVVFDGIPGSGRLVCIGSAPWLTYWRNIGRQMREL
jgi:hypothetical protein